MIFDDEYYNDVSGGNFEEVERSPFFEEFDEDEDDDNFEDDGQPSEYDEWQDFMGGDDWDHGQYDCDY